MKVAHLGINAANAENAAQIAELFHVLFGFEPKYGNSSIFVGDKMIEIVKENGRGTNGHICIAVDDMAKAMDELKEKASRLTKVRQSTKTESLPPSTSKTKSPVSRSIF